MASIHSVTFSISGWQLQEVKQYQKTWVNPEFKEIMSLNLFRQRPDFTANLSDISALREQSAHALRQFNATIIDINTDHVDNIPALRQIIKVPQPKQTHGMIYIGTYTIPFQKFSYVIKVQCPEIGVTGQRESLAISELMRDGKLTLTDPDDSPSSSQIPPEMQELVSVTSDSPKFDAVFPNHPLTRMRQHLIILKETIQLDASVHLATPFSI